MRMLTEDAQKVYCSGSILRTLGKEKSFSALPAAEGQSLIHLKVRMYSIYTIHIRFTLPYYVIPTIMITF